MTDTHITVVGMNRNPRDDQPTDGAPSARQGGFGTQAQGGRGR